MQMVGAVLCHITESLLITLNIKVHCGSEGAPDKPLLLKLDVYHLNMMCNGNFQFAEHFYEHNKVTKHDLIGNTPLTCLLWP